MATLISERQNFILKKERKTKAMEEEKEASNIAYSNGFTLNTMNICQFKKDIKLSIESKQNDDSVSKIPIRYWTENETKILLDKYFEFYPSVGLARSFSNKSEMWEAISSFIKTKTANQCMEKYKTLMKKVKRTTEKIASSNLSLSQCPQSLKNFRFFSDEENRILLETYEQYKQFIGPTGIFKSQKDLWEAVALKLPTKTADQCKERYKTINKREICKTYKNSNTKHSKQIDCSLFGALSNSKPETISKELILSITSINSRNTTPVFWKPSETDILLTKYNQYLPEIGEHLRFKTQKDMWVAISQDVQTKSYSQCIDKYKTIIRKHKKDLAKSETNYVNKKFLNKYEKFNIEIENILASGVLCYEVLHDDSTSALRVWKNSEIEILLDTYRNYSTRLGVTNLFKTKCQMWDAIALVLKTKSASQCKEKFKSLIKKARKIISENSSTLENISESNENYDFNLNSSYIPDSPQYYMIQSDDCDYDNEQIDAFNNSNLDNTMCRSETISDEIIEITSDDDDYDEGDEENYEEHEDDYSGYPMVECEVEAKELEDEAHATEIIDLENDDDDLYLVEPLPNEQNISKNWTTDETEMLIDKVKCYSVHVGKKKFFRHKSLMWKSIAKEIKTKTALQCISRHRNILRRKVKTKNTKNKNEIIMKSNKKVNSRHSKSSINHRSIQTFEEIYPTGSPSKVSYKREKRENWTDNENEMFLQKFNEYIPKVGLDDRFINKKEMFKIIANEIGTKTAGQCNEKYKTIMRKQKRLETEFGIN